MVHDLIVLDHEKGFRDRSSGFMTLEIIIILLTIILAVYFLFTDLRLLSHPAIDVTPGSLTPA